MTGAIDSGERIVTLTGPLGIGKTRLALACVERLGPRFARGGGAWFCDLSHVTTEAGLALEPGADPDAPMRRLVELPGIGPWTANYVAMRALRWTDAFPKEDIVIRKQLGKVTPSEAERMSQSWRPWRSYATMHLWRSE